jgi:hypothetical protein
MDGRAPGLDVPHVAGVSGQAARFQRLDEGLALDDRPASRVDQPGALLHVEDPHAVEQTSRIRRQGSMDVDDVGLLNKLVEICPANAEDVFVDAETSVRVSSFSGDPFKRQACLLPGDHSAF